MQSSASVFKMPFRKKLRSGQIQAFEKAVEDPLLSSLNVKFPTGYGKSFVAAGLYSIKRRQGKTNRMLAIFPTDKQLDQFVKDGHIDLRDAGVDGPLQIMDIRYYGAEAIKAHRTNQRQIFAITIQSLLESRGANNVRALMETGCWFVWVDEHHHYGEGKAWARNVLSLPRNFLLADSATPNRPGKDGVFGTPDISVSYKDAVKERAVKPLRGHSYEYRLDIVDAEGNVRSLTTTYLAKEAGGDDPVQIENFMIKKKYKWKPKWISPLISRRLDRMLRERKITGYKLQGLISALCVSHAKFTCDLIRDLYPELRVEWVGTGNDGRTDEENKRLLNEFCPPKNEDGERPESQIDVLVHVGMAGEGLDSVFVSENVFLRSANFVNQVFQIIGRGSRYLPGVICHVSFDSSCELAKGGYIGENIEDAMDYAPPTTTPNDDPPETGWPDPLPDEPLVQVFEVELLNIDSGDPGVQRMGNLMCQLQPSEFDYQNLADKDHPDWEKVIQLYKTMRMKEAEELNPRATIEIWKRNVEEAVSAIARLCYRILEGRGQQVESATRGKIRTAINTRKKFLFGAKAPDIELLRNQYKWCKSVENGLHQQREIPPNERRLPSWIW